MWHRVAAIDCRHCHAAREGEGREGEGLLPGARLASDDTHLFIKLQQKSLNRNGRKVDDGGGGGGGDGTERGSGDRVRAFVRPPPAPPSERRFVLFDADATDRYNYWGRRARAARPRARCLLTITIIINGKVITARGPA